MRKNIDISPECVAYLEKQAVAENRPVKNLIETQLEAMGKAGETYTRIYETNQQLEKRLKELTPLKNVKK